MSTTSAFLIGVVASLASILLTWGYKQLVLRLSDFNDRWGLRWARADLARVRLFRSDAAALDHFVKARVTLWIAVFSGSLLLVPVALSGSTDIVAAVWWGFGMALYGLALHTAAIVYWTGNSEKFMAILEGRIDRRERRLAQRRSEA